MALYQFHEIIIYISVVAGQDNFTTFKQIYLYMNLLELIAQEINGKSYHSVKYCYDNDIRKAISFDDKQEITFKQ